MAEHAKTVDWDKVKAFAGVMVNDLGAAMDLGYERYGLDAIAPERGQSFDL